MADSLLGAVLLQCCRMLEVKQLKPYNKLEFGSDLEALSCFSFPFICSSQVLAGPLLLMKVCIALTSKCAVGARDSNCWRHAHTLSMALALSAHPWAAAWCLLLKHVGAGTRV